MTPLLCWHHDVGHRLGAVPGALRVDVDDAIELILGHRDELRVLHDARVVDQHVDAAVALHHRLDHGLNRRAVGDVHEKPMRVATDIANRGDGLIDGRLVQVADDDDRALRGANLSAVACPMPRPAPVMMDTLSSSRMIDLSSLCFDKSSTQRTQRSSACERRQCHREFLVTRLLRGDSRQDLLRSLVFLCVLSFPLCDLCVKIFGLRSTRTRKSRAPTHRTPRREHRRALGCGD